jgi:uncharacterized protein (TIGR02246 family)
MTEIEKVVAKIQHAQQNELPEEFLSVFREDAVWTTGHGRRLFGRDEIGEFTRKVLPGAMRESKQTYEVEHVVFIRPDVAAVKVRQHTVTLDGQPIEGAQVGSPLYVIALENGEWRIVAAQNTIVVD